MQQHDRDRRSGAVGHTVSGARAFLNDERGAITTDMVMIFLPVIVLVLTVFEIGISFYLLLSAQKAAQMGVRFVAAEDPLHADVPRQNRLDPSVAQVGDSCYRPGEQSACLAPTAPDTIRDEAGTAIAQGWLCDGTAFDAAICDETRFEALVREMQIVYPGLNREEVRAYYVYEELGYAGGPFQPRVAVSITARESPIQILSLADLVWGSSETGPTVGLAEPGTGERIRLREVTASVFGADLNSTNVSE